MLAQEPRRKEMEEVDDTFIRPLRKRKTGRLKKSAKRLKIILTSSSTTIAATTSQQEKTKGQNILDAWAHPLKFEISQDKYDDVSDWDESESVSANDLEQQLEDSLKFFRDTHEDQSPAFTAFQKQLADKDRQKRLQELEEADRRGRQEIDTVIAQLIKERNEATDRSLEKYRERAAQDEKQNTQRLLHAYKQKTASSLQRIGDSMKALESRHQEEMHQAMQHHQVQASQRRLNEAMASQEWQHTSQQIQVKHQRQMQMLRGKGEEYKAKTNDDFKREQDKIRKQYISKLHEIDLSRQKVFTKVHAQMQQARQRHIKRHFQRIMKEKEKLLTKSATNDKLEAELKTALNSECATNSIQGEVTKSTMERAELNPPCPIKSLEPWAAALPTVSGASTRHKHRKGVMNQTVRQLSLEIHNEGIWLSATENNDEKKIESSSNKRVDYEFVPWGTKAHDIVNAIICGEIPPGYERLLEKHPQAAELSQTQGGQVRCIATDLRTSVETASQQRSSAIKEQDESFLKNLEIKVTKLIQQVVEAENAIKTVSAYEKEQTSKVYAAAEEVKTAMRIQEEFKTKFHQFLGTDGNPVSDASPNDQKELQKAMLRYKTNLDTALGKAKREKMSLTEAKSKLQKLQTMLKTSQRNYTVTANILKTKLAQKTDDSLSLSLSGGHGNQSKQSSAAEMERAATQVKDAIGALQSAAERRRGKYEQKKSTSLSSAWVQSFPGLPSALKKSLWHKMHRRKQQIILRPSEESLITELRACVEDAVAPKYAGRSLEERRTAINEELLKAEQRFLIAVHPLGDASVSCVPPTKSSGDWAEPGWHLNLEVADDHDDSMILPCAKSFPILERNLAERASAPGCQAASLMRPSHLRCLASPLSVFAIASAPAEVNTSLLHTREFTRDDPLYVSDEEMKLGYAFAITPLNVKQTAPNRKRVSTAKAAPTHQISSLADSSSLIKMSTPTSSQAGEQMLDQMRRTSKKVAPLNHSPRTHSHAPPVNVAVNIPPSLSPPQPSHTPLTTALPPSHYTQSQQQQYQQQHMLLQNSQNSQNQTSIQGVPNSQPLHSRHYSGQQQHHYARPSDPYHHQRIMQQQQHSPRHHQQQMNPNYAQIHQMQQFYAPLNHPVHMQGRQPMSNSAQQQRQGAPGNSQQPNQMGQHVSHDLTETPYMMGKK